MAAQAAQVDTARQKMVEPELDDWRLRYSVGSAINIRQAWLSEEHFLAVRQAYMIIIDHIYIYHILDIATSLLDIITLDFRGSTAQFCMIDIINHH